MSGSFNLRLEILQSLIVERAGFDVESRANKQFQSQTWDSSLWSLDTRHSAIKCGFSIWLFQSQTWDSSLWSKHSPHLIAIMTFLQSVSISDLRFFSLIVAKRPLARHVPHMLGVSISDLRFFSLIGTTSASSQKSTQVSISDLRFFSLIGFHDLSLGHLRFNLSWDSSLWSAIIRCARSLPISLLFQSQTWDSSLWSLHRRRLSAFKFTYKPGFQSQTWDSSLWSTYSLRSYSKMFVSISDLRFFSLISLGDFEISVCFNLILRFFSLIAANAANRPTMPKSFNLRLEILLLIDVRQVTDVNIAGFNLRLEILLFD